MGLFGMVSFQIVQRTKEIGIRKVLGASVQSITTLLSKEFLKLVFKEKNVVGFDMVELCPNSTEKSSDFLAAKLYYKMLSYKFASNDDSYDNSVDEDNNNPFSKLSKFKNDDDDF